MYQLPAMQREGFVQIGTEREISRKEIQEERARSDARAEASRRHGEQAVEKFGTALENLGDRLSEGQEKTNSILRQMNTRQAIQAELPPGISP
jgi:hypothetical protein